MTAQIPYHLRTNKNVERTLFIELLRIIGPFLPVPPRSYRYVGLGGPLLQDFAVLQSVFPTQKMISLEQEGHVLKRQKFNLPNSRTLLTPQVTTDFANAYQTGKNPLLVWFDYTRHNWRDQITESCDLLKKLPDFSIFKITIPCNLSKWNTRDSGDKVPEARLKNLNDNFTAFGPFSAADVTNKNFRLTMYRICRRAFLDAIPDSLSRVCRPLSAYTYDDGTPILTVSVIVGTPDGIRKSIRTSQLGQWPYSRIRWGTPIDIDIPDLSVREHQAIERLLPDTGAAKIHDRLKLSFAQGRGNSLKILSNFVKFSKHAPHFVKLSQQLL